MVTAEELIKVADEDISFFDRWLDSMTDSSDSMLRIMDQAVKKSKENARLSTIDIMKKLEAATIKLEKAGIKDTSWMFEKDKNFFMRNNIKVVFSGRDEPLPQKVIDCRNKLSEMTKDNTGGIFNVCLNYGGRAEIVDACKKLINEGIPAEEITEEVFHEHLYQNLPDVDLLIRTSGEVRLSNYLLWELSYAEFIFYPEKFPGFTRDDYDKCVAEFTRRDRRFGGIKEN
jgi:undecaprenyl diphosphate synthase